MPPFIPYRIATLPNLHSHWEASPFDYKRRRALGRVEIVSSSWRHDTGRGTIQLLSLLHPRLVDPKLDETVLALLDNLVWLQRLGVQSSKEVFPEVPGATAHGRELVLVFDASQSIHGGLLDPILGTALTGVGSRTLHVLGIGWSLDGLSDSILILTGDSDLWQEMMKIPASIEYEKIRWPAFH